ncbi:MAG: hypothetical protein Kow00109_20290 [Acidobacteriota bacterium]
MNKRLIASLLATLCTLVFVHAADPTGTWEGTLESDFGPIHIVIKIEAQDPLTGTVTVGPYFTSDIENGKLEGDKISFEIQHPYGSTAFTGTVREDEMDLMVTGGDGRESRLLCKRQK